MEVVSKLLVRLSVVLVMIVAYYIGYLVYGTLGGCVLAAAVLVARIVLGRFLR